MLKYAKVINEETKQCEVGLGDPTAIFDEVEKVRTWQETEKQEQVVPAEYDEQGNLVKEETTEIIEVPVEKSENYIETTTVGQFYESIGMIEQDVEQAYNGDWYLKGYAPTQPLDELKALKRSERDAMLKSTDVYMLPDFPISDEERQLYKQYRQYLRDLPESKDFPDVDVLSFDDWQAMK